MTKQKREFIEDSIIDSSENSESNSSENSESNSENSEPDSSDNDSEILETYNCDESESETSTGNEGTINGRPINKKKIVKKEYNDIRDVMFEHIDKEYAHGKLGEFDIIMMKKNGYINATKLCKKNKKNFFNWSRSKNTKMILKYLEESLEYTGDLIISVKSGDNLTRGSYVHQLLIIHVASWCSAEYAIKVSRIVNEYHIKQAMKIKDKLLKKGKDKIDELINLNKEMDKKMNQVLKKNDKLLKKNDILLKKNDILLKDNEDFRRRDDIMSNKVDHLVNEIEIKSDGYVVEGNPNARHILVIIKTNELPKKIKNKKGKFITTHPKFDYIALRVMKKSYQSRIKKITDEFPKMKILLEIKYTPNSMNLWDRIKKDMNMKKIAVSGSRFKRLVGYSEKRMIREIHKIDDERYDYDD